MSDGSGNDLHYLTGSEVAHARRIDQPGFDGQMSLLKSEADLRRKLIIALVIVLSVFICGMIAGAVAGIFI